MTSSCSPSCICVKQQLSLGNTLEPPAELEELLMLVSHLRDSDSIGLEKGLDIRISKIFPDDSNVRQIIINNYSLCARYCAKDISYIISFNPHFPDEEACSEKVREQ